MANQKPRPGIQIGYLQIPKPRSHGSRKSSPSRKQTDETGETLGNKREIDTRTDHNKERTTRQDRRTHEYKEMIEKAIPEKSATAKQDMIPETQKGKIQGKQPRISGSRGESPQEREKEKRKNKTRAGTQIYDKHKKRKTE